MFPETINPEIPTLFANNFEVVIAFDTYAFPVTPSVVPS